MRLPDFDSVSGHFTVVTSRPSITVTASTTRIVRSRTASLQLFHDQWRLALSHHSQCRSHFFHRHLGLLLVTTQDLGKHGNVRVLGRLRYLLQKLFDPNIIDLVERFFSQLSDSLIGGTLQTSQLALLFWLNEQDRVPFTSRSPRPTDPVNVGFGVVRKIVVDHMADAFNVQTTSRHVSGHQHIDAPRFQLVDSTLALALLNVTVKCRHAIASLSQKFTDHDRGNTGFGENNHAVRFFALQQTVKRLCFVTRMDEHQLLGDRIGRCRFALDCDVFRVSQVLASNAANVIGHRRREHDRLSLTRNVLKDPLNVIHESHSQHFIGFIKHECFQGSQIKRFTTDVIHHSSGRSDDNLHASLKRTNLSLIALATVDADRAKAFDVSTVLVKRRGHLESKFSGWSKHKNLRTLCIQINLRKQRQSKGCRFARSGLGLTDQVQIRQHDRNRFGLNFGRSNVARFGD